MTRVDQRLVPGIVGMSTYVDAVYELEMQRAAVANPARPLHRLKAVLAKMDYELFVINSEEGRPDRVEEQIADAAATLHAAGAGFVIVTSGTGNLLTGLAQRRVPLPILDLERASWAEARRVDHAVVGVLSTRHAAASGMYRALADADGARLLIPDPATGERIDALIYDDLVQGIVSPAGVDVVTGAIADLARRGAECVLVGNTSMTLMIDEIEAAAQVPLIDAARAHARAAGRAALSGDLADAVRP